MLTLNEQHEETQSDLNQSVGQKLEEISAMVEMQLDQFLNSLDAKLTNFLAEVHQKPKADSKNAVAELDFDTADIDAIACAVTKKHERPSADTANDSLAHLSEWDRRKQQMLAEYGMHSDEIAAHTSKPKSQSHGQVAEVEAKSAAEVLDSRQPPRRGDCKEDHALEALHDSIAKLDKIDTLEIEELKEQLTSKLRDAEVELSINRAKLSQQWATLEQKQFEISQRESSLQAKYGNLSEATKKAGLLDRLSRHLSRRSDDSQS
jgi:hypothetical protein